MDSRQDILLKERVSKVDDINFDKIFDTTEVATRELNNFDKEVVVDESISKISNFAEKKEENALFSIEVAPNEFFDNINIKEETVKPKKKMAIQNKPLFFTVTSIAVLLCILFIYNLFMINNLQSASRSSAALVSTSETIVAEND